MKSKKGSHVGIVLSFVIFITFLAFLYAVIGPAISSRSDKQSFLDYAEAKLRGEFSTDLMSVSIAINKSVFAQDCFQFEGLIEPNEINTTLILKNETKDILPAYISQDGLTLYVDRTNSEGNFFKIFVSEEFPEIEEYTGVPPQPSPCKVFEEGANVGYDLGLIRIEREIFETKIIKALNNYTDYAEFKEELSIAPEDNFGFSFTYNNGTIIGTEDEDVFVNVFAEEFPIQYIDRNANQEVGFINIRVW
jgi:hypothetical protein